MSYLPICLLCLVLVAAFLYVEVRKQYVFAAALKGAASACFVVLGFLSAGLASEPMPARFIVIGLVLGAVADVLLALRYVFPKQKQPVFLAGILVFLLGHIMYLAPIVPRCPVLLASVLVGIGATALLMYWIFGRITAEQIFKLFGIVYMGIVTILNTVAIGTMLAQPTTFSAMFVLGALLFLVSDVVLVLNTFGPRERLEMRIANISLYYLAQLLIALTLQVL